MLHATPLTPAPAAARPRPEQAGRPFRGRSSATGGAFRPRHDTLDPLAHDALSWPPPIRRPPISGREDIPRLVEAWSEGDETAFERLVTLLYDDLRDLAHSHLQRERADHTLNTTALVHEAYVQLADGAGPAWRGRPQFYAFLSRVMRHVLVDYARRRRAQKRGGGATPLTLREDDLAWEPAAVDIIALDQALEKLASRDARLATLVECRFFGGLTEREIAEVLGVSERTVERNWKRARAYLHRLLAPEPQQAD